MTPDRPNVILIVFDTARADAFDPYGAGRGTTPAVAQLASRGIARRDAFSTSNWTMPAHVSMFSGLLPRMAGLAEVPDGDRGNCRLVMEQHRDRWLPEVLRRAGYSTKAATTNSWVTEPIGFGTGFDEFRNFVGGRVTGMQESGTRQRVRWYMDALLASVDDGLAATEEQLNEWVSSADRPFFWFVNLLECHAPYLPPQPYNDLGPIERLRAGRDARRHQSLDGVWKACATGTMPDPRSLERMRHLYSRAIRMMDDWLARLLERLDKHGLLDDTLVILTSDHGENFGEDDLLGHAFSLDDRLIRVPLVMAGPGAPSAPDGVMSLAALPRLIAEAIDLEDHPWMEDSPAAGSDVAVSEYAVLVPSPDDPRLEILRGWGASEERVRRFANFTSAATDGRHKLVARGSHEELFDLDADPLETMPIDPAAAPASVVDPLRGALSNARDRAWTPDVAALRERGDGSMPSSDEMQELEERLRLLGYM